MRFRNAGRLLDTRPLLLVGGAVVVQWISTLIAAQWSRPDESFGDAVVLLNVVLLGPLMLAAAFTLARRIAGPALGIWTLVVWLSTPWLLVAIALPGYRAEIRDLVLPLVLGLDAEPGYPAAAAVLVAAVAVTVGGWRAAAGAGAALGIAALLVPTTFVFAAAAAVALLVERRPKALAVAGAAFLPFAVALALSRGLSLDARSLDAFQGAMGGLREYFWSQRLLQWTPLAGTVAVARRSPSLALLLGGGFVAFALLQTARPSADVADAGFFRVLLPGLPTCVLLVAAIPLLVPTLAARLGEHARPLPLR